MDIATLFSHTTAGNERELCTLLDEHPFLLHVRNPDRSTWGESSLLECAAKHGHLDIVKLLVDRGAEVYSNPVSSYPPVIYAAWNEHQTVVDYFLREIPDRASGTNKLGVTVTLAAREGWTDLVRRHIEADPLCVHQRGWWPGYTPLHWSTHNGHVEIVELLLDANADIEADCLMEYGYGGKPLHWASQHEPAAAQILLEHGANVNSRIAIEQSRRDGFTPLIMNAANRKHVYEEGVVWSDRRVIGGHIDCGCFKADCAEVTEQLLSAGADINATDAEGRTALAHALKGGLQRITEVLRRHNASE